MNIVGLDASNLQAGGGLTHIRMLLDHAEPEKFGIDKIVVWGGKNTLEKLPEREWLIKVNPPILNHSMPFRFLWQQVVLPACLKQYKCNCLFSPGGTTPIFFKNIKAVTMQQNLLVFEDKEADRYPPKSAMRIRLKILKFFQKRSLQNSQSIIFLSKYAKNCILPQLDCSPKKTSIVKHGLEKRFFHKPEKPDAEKKFNNENPFRLLYVSIIDIYKHQDKVAEAVADLRAKGIDVTVDFIGPAYKGIIEKFKGKILRLDPTGNNIKYHGAIPFEDLHEFYQNADAFIFASSCENLPIILLEAMASGKAIACSNKGPMPEVLGDGGVYFNPEQVGEISSAIEELLNSGKKRFEMAEKSFALAKKYSWKDCAENTLKCISELIREK